MTNNLVEKILVTGATGQQGSAVVRQLLALDQAVRVMLRDTQSDAAKALAEQGCELVQGDLDRPASLPDALNGVAAAFLVLPLSDARTEIRRGRAFIEAARETGLPYLLFSAALDANHETGVAHFDSKHQLIGELANSRLHHNVLGPGGFMENLLFPQTWNGLAKGRLVTPFAIHVPQAMVAVDDIGRHAALDLARPPSTSGSFIPLYSDCLSTSQQAAIMSQQLGHPIKARKLPWLLTRIFLGRQLTGMFDYFNREQNPKPPDNNSFVQSLGKPTAFSAWLSKQTPPK